MLELTNTVIVYKFPQLTCQEIESMFSVSDLKQPKVYQEAHDEGRVEGEITSLLRQLNYRFGAIAPETETQIRTLSLS